jgi:hypothetical protein
MYIKYVYIYIYNIYVCFNVKALIDYIDHATIYCLVALCLLCPEMLEMTIYAAHEHHP